MTCRGLSFIAVDSATVNSQKTPTNAIPRTLSRPYSMRKSSKPKSGTFLARGRNLCVRERNLHVSAYLMHVYERRKHIRDGRLHVNERRLHRPRTAAAVPESSPYLPVRNCQDRARLNSTLNFGTHADSRTAPKLGAQRRDHASAVTMR